MQPIEIGSFDSNINFREINRFPKLLWTLLFEDTLYHTFIFLVINRTGWIDDETRWMSEIWEGFWQDLILEFAQLDCSILLIFWCLKIERALLLSTWLLMHFHSWTWTWWIAYYNINVLQCGVFTRLTFQEIQVANLNVPACAALMYTFFQNGETRGIFFEGQHFPKELT
jgi:hypothetical protein